MKKITITEAHWGYVTNLVTNINPKYATDDKRHTLAPGLGGTTVPGVPDKLGYGYCRPLDTVGVSQAELDLHIEWSNAASYDYYVALRNGSPFPDAVAMFYERRVFVTGDNLSNPSKVMERSELLHHLAALGIRDTSHAWDPCQVLYGAAMGGVPRFASSLRQNTEFGPSWYSVQHKLQNPPVGGRYQVRQSPGSLQIDIYITDGDPTARKPSVRQMTRTQLSDQIAAANAAVPEGYRIETDTLPERVASMARGLRASYEDRETLRLHNRKMRAALRGISRIAEHDSASPLAYETIKTTADAVLLETDQ